MIKKSLAVLLVSLATLIAVAPGSSAVEPVNRGEYPTMEAAQGACIMGKWAGQFERCDFVISPRGPVYLFTNR
ncbi:hypothetical protein [Amycolatopsis sp. WAC 04197]|uniref:hypothetical protein n=1 Tax=Amycolatopsis sp. WAC 04197 TaxID=2203199 RepID=UPI000F7AC50D|nr:hypothetical protein [Amycolatopsis sp. WAC 04197]